jgi:hypothetical protein
MRVTRLAAVACTITMAAGLLSACESGADKAAEHDLEQAADVAVCAAAATPAPTPYGQDFPRGWPFPPRTIVHHAEDRGADGTIVTGISSAPFRTVLAFMNTDVVDAGFTIEEGETEEHDAEAEWEGNGFRGRWAIRESAACPGETVIQVLATSD